MRSVDAFTVPPALAGDRVDRAVALVTGWTRADVQSLLAAGAVLVDGQTVGKSHRLVAGATIELLAEPVPDEPPGPEPVGVDVRYVDDEVIVVAKPAGMVVHPGAGHPHGTLVHGLLHRFPEVAAVGDAARPGIVHRLDRDTSGLMVVARTEHAYEALVGALAARAVERGYLALVWGSPAASRGVVDAPIGRSPRRPTRMAVRESGKEARTSYEVRRGFAGPVVSLLECRLETGRTHQIRVHLAAIGHPVVGDAAYGGARSSLRVDRPLLHASTLRLAHPATGEPLSFAEPLPADFATVLERLEGD